MTFHPATAWQLAAEPIHGGAAFDPAQVTQHVFHWPGGYAPASLAAVPAYLQAAQHSYLTDPKRGYSLGYSYAFDQWGDIWGIRERRFRCAANSVKVNGQPDVQNVKSIAYLLLLGADDAPSDAMEASIRAQLAEDRAALGRVTVLLGHRDLEPTACPGDHAYQLIGSGTFNPPPPPAPAPQPQPTPEVPPMQLARLIRFRGFTNVFLVGAGTPLHCTAELVADYRAEGVPAQLIARHPQLERSLLAQCGLTGADMSAGGPDDVF